MTNLLYLALAVLLSFAGCLVIWFRNRKPTSLESGIEDFQRELRALDPMDGRPDKGDRRSG